MKRFQYFIIGFSILCVVLLRARGDIRRDCRKQTNVSWGALKKLKAGNFNQDDRSLKCYLRCFMMKNGILDRNSDLDVERVLRHLPPGLHKSSRRILSKCKDLPGMDVCDKAHQIALCYYKSEPEILTSVAFV